VRALDNKPQREALAVLFWAADARLMNCVRRYEGDVSPVLRRRSRRASSRRPACMRFAAHGSMAAVAADSDIQAKRPAAVRLELRGCVPDAQTVLQGFPPAR